MDQYWTETPGNLVFAQNMISFILEISDSVFPKDTWGIILCDDIVSIEDLM